MENEIKEFFRTAAPLPGDATSFRLELNAKLVAAEQIRQVRDSEIRRSRRILYAVFAAGLLLGGGVTAVALLQPDWLTGWWEGLRGLLSVPAVPLGDKAAALPLWPAALLPLAILAIALPLLLLRRHTVFRN